MAAGRSAELGGIDGGRLKGSPRKKRRWFRLEIFCDGFPLALGRVILALGSCRAVWTFSDRALASEAGYVSVGLHLAPFCRCEIWGPQLAAERPVLFAQTAGDESLRTAPVFPG